jgi:hypothetical protein
MNSRLAPFAGLARQRAFVVLAVLAVLALAVALVSQGRPGTDDSTSFPMTGGAEPGFARGAPAPGAIPAPPPDGFQRDLKAPEEGMRFESDAATGSDGSMGLGGGETTLLSADLLGRKIIRNGSLDLEVESVGDAFERIRQVAESAGGFVADSTFVGSAERQSAYLTLRVPAARFGDVVSQLRGLAVEVHSISTSAQDVTEEFTDLEATLRNLRAVETQYIELLGRANTIGEILQVQDRLNQVRLQLDRVQGRMQMLEALTDMATIQVTLRPEKPATVATIGGEGILDAARAAWAASLESIEAIAKVIVVAVVYSWWLIPIALVLLVVLRRLLPPRERVVTVE